MKRFRYRLYLRRSSRVWTALLFVCALTSQQCTSQPPAAASTAAAPAAPSLESSMTPALSVRELMVHIVDPTADWIWDAAVIDITHKGIAETKPLSDDDWLKVERGGYLIAESANLLKIPRRVASPEEESHAKPGEVAPAQIQAKIEQNRMLWIAFADGLRTAGLEAAKAAKARNTEALFAVGDQMDKACEACHLEYWYPGDRPAVLKNQNSKVTYDPPKK